MNNYKCHDCGAALDPGERCDCTETGKAAPEGNGNSQPNTLYTSDTNAVNTGGKMKLLKLSLSNFQGINNAEFEFNGKSASIYGDNATGKTTIFNAFTWLLFDKPSTGAKNFTPKTKSKDGDMHNLEHSAEAVFQLADGRIRTLKKTYKEVYKKKRGSSSAEFDGHTVDYFVDGVPTKENEYKSTVEEFCGSAENLKMLTMPDYFSEAMEWQDRRRILLDICGDISDQDIIAMDSALAELETILLMPGTGNQHYSVDEYKKVAIAKKADINKQLVEIPSRIDEAQKAMPDISEIDEAETQTRIDELTKQLATLNEQKAMAMMGDTSKLRQKIAEAETRLIQARAEYTKKHAEAELKLNNDFLLVKTEELEAVNKINRIESVVATLANECNRHIIERKRLIDEYRTVAAQTWDNSKNVCPTCKRDLPELDIETMKNEFNLSRSKRLEEINELGQAHSEEVIDRVNADIAELENKQQLMLKETLPTIRMRLAELISTEVAPPFETTSEYTELNAQICDLKASLENSTESISAQLNTLDRQAQELTNEITAERSKIIKLQASRIQQKRIEELEQSETNLASAYEELERGIHLCELFIKTKVSALTERINGRFKSVRFRLFVEQLNGGLKEDCEVMIPSADGRLVPYTFANNAARINAGLEIISTLSEHFNAAMPVFIDNAESVTRIEPVSSQVIRLVVSEADKALRIDITP